MDMKVFEQKLEEMFRKEDVQFEKMQDEDEAGAIWYFDIDELFGFVQYENSGKIDYNGAVVNIALNITSLENYDKDELLEILQINSVLSSMHLTAELDPEKENVCTIFLQRSIAADKFVAEDFPRHIQDMVDVMDEVFE